MKRGVESAHWLRQVSVSPLLTARFTRQLATLVHSGIPVHRGVEILSLQCLDARFSEVLYALHCKVEEGHRLSAAAADCPRVFTPMYQSLLRVAEETGRLALCLNLLADWLERDCDNRNQLRQAFTYPTLVLLISLGVSFLVVHSFAPPFIDMYREQGLALPWPTAGLAALVDLTRWRGFPVAAVAWLALLWLGWRDLAPREGVQLRLRNWAARLPALGPLLNDVAWARFCAAAAVTQRCGVSPAVGLGLACQASGDLRFWDLRLTLNQALRDGKAVSEVFQEQPDPYCQRVGAYLQVAEESGRLERAFDLLARDFGAAFVYRLTLFTQLAEPVLLFLASVLVLFLTLALLLPLYAQFQNL